MRIAPQAAAIAGVVTELPGTAAGRPPAPGRLGRLPGHVQRVAQRATTAAHEMRHQGEKNATRARSSLIAGCSKSLPPAYPLPKFPLNTCLGLDPRGAAVRYTMTLPAKVGRSLLGRRQGQAPLPANFAAAVQQLFGAEARMAVRQLPERPSTASARPRTQ